MSNIKKDRSVAQTPLASYGRKSAISFLSAATIVNGKYSSKKYSYKKIQTPKDEARKYFHKGRLFAIDGKNEQAIKAYKKALEIEPNDRAAQDNSRIVNWLKGKYSYQKRPIMDFCTSDQAKRKSQFLDKAMRFGV
ncbi:tetratricopeptide repeat protein [Acidobacteria bacterium AH-259-A15]|nr:tetratricopeptide repeat protein [Acidobacteria bacterium AH-259-A15]